MSSFLQKEAQCVCKNKLVIVLDHVAIKMKNDVLTNVKIKQCIKKNYVRTAIK